MDEKGIPAVSQVLGLQTTEEDHKKGLYHHSDEVGRAAESASVVPHPILGKSSMLGNGLRARSNPVRKKPGIQFDSFDQEPYFEIRSAGVEQKVDLNKSLKATASKSLETVLGLNVKKEPLITRHMLFKEAMYTSIHMLGDPTHRYPSNQEDISVYSLVTFSTDEKEQVAVLEHVRGEAYPLTVVSTMAKRAEGLAGRNDHTLSDTYCFVGLETLDSLDQKEWKTINIGSPQRPRRSSYPTKDRIRPLAENRLNQVYTNLPSHVRTVVQLQASNPVWEQRFQCIALRPSVDILTVEIWDHDDEKTVLRAIKYAKDAKKAHEVEKGKEDLVDDFYQGKRDNFMGKVTQKVQDIPVDGQERWYNLTGKSHRGKDAVGRILLQNWLTHAYRHGRHFVDYAEPKVMLERLWDYILHVESGKHGTNWTGEIPVAATCLLFQYGLQTGLSEATQAIIRWNSYAKHHLGLYGVGPRLTELDSVLNRIYQEESDHQRNSELETSMVVLCIERLCPIIRNHLREPQERVNEAMKSIKHCRNILAKYNSEAAIARIDWLVNASLRMSILEWYDAKYHEIINLQNMTEQHEQVVGVSLVMNKVNNILEQGQTKWKALFWMQGTVEYMPIVYDELQKMVIHDVEPLAWSVLQHYYGNNDKLRRILLRWSPTTGAYENGWDLCQALFKLFVETQIFVMAQADIFDEGLISPYAQLNDYHLWFRPVLVMWLGYTFIKSCEMTTKAIHLDDVRPEDSYVKISSSAIDTAVVFQQLASFWKELNWPDVAESYVILHFIIDMMCRIAILYTHLHRKRLSAEGFFDTEDRFDISDRLCTAFNNLEYVKDAALKVPLELKIENLLNNLEKHLGESTSMKYRKNIDNTIFRMGRQIEKMFREILESVADRVRPEIHSTLEGSLILLRKGKEITHTLDPLFSYLQDNLVVLDNSLMESNFFRFLLMFWTVTCEEIYSVAKNFPLSSTAEQIIFFNKLQEIFPPIMNYFKSGLTDIELHGKEFENAEKLLIFLTMDTQSLIRLYYEELANGEMILKRPSNYGTLNVHVHFWNGKLNVHVINAQNLVPMDAVGFFIFKKKPSSDPVIEIEILPEDNFHESIMKHTETKWKTLNPEFDEKFSWNVNLKECLYPYSTIRFTAKDYDALSKNDFLGEALVPLSKIPGVVEDGAITQPMALHLRTVDPDNFIIVALKSRHWDTTAQEFVSKQIERFIE